MATRRPLVPGTQPAQYAALAAGDTLIGFQSVNNQTGTSYTVAATDGGKIVTFTNAAAIAVALPAASTFGAGWYVELQNIGTTQVTITPTTSTIDGAATFVLGPGQGVKLLSDGTNYFTMRGWGVSLNAPSFTGGINVTGNSTFSADVVAATFNSQKLSNGGQTNSLVIGAGAGVVGAGSTAIGAGASVSGVSTDSTVVGYAAAASGSFATAIGRSANANGGGTAIGYGTSTNSTYGVALGYGSTSSGGGLAIGGNASASGSLASVAMGRNAVASVNGQVVFGATNLPLNDVYFGTGVTDTNAPTTTTIQSSGGSGTDIAGADIVLAGGKATGAGTPGMVIFKTATVGTTGTTLQSLAERARITANGIALVASNYLNFGTTYGSSGYGVRDNAGTVEVKNSAGSWFAPVSSVSPAFTGTPTAPTAAPGTNSTQIATTAFVAASFAPITTPTFSSSVAINGAAATNRLLGFYTSNVPRWTIYADNSAESGSNAGSNFAISRYNDAGTVIDSLLLINRATGIVSFGNTIRAGLGSTGVTILTDSPSATDSYTNFGNLYSSGNAVIGFMVKPNSAGPGYVSSVASAQVRGAIEVSNIIKFLTATSSVTAVGTAVTMTETMRVDGTGAMFPASYYINFGSTSGSAGYGIRDNAGAIEFKNSAGSWTGFGGFATLASPTFTGVPAAPTAAADTNTTQIATTAFVIGQASAATPLIDGTAAVGTSLRYARADHVHPTDTSRAPLASPTFTGTVTIPKSVFGGGTYYTSANYSGTTTNAALVLTLGSSGTPDTTQDSAAIFEKQANSSTTTGQNATVFVGMTKNMSANATHATALFAEAIDPVGGANTWLEGGRFHAFGTGGVNGGFYGLVSAAGVTTGISYTYMVGIEATNENYSGSDAPQFWSFSKAKFSAAFVATNLTNGTGSKSDAAFLTNPYSGTPWKTGYLVYGYDGAQRGVEDTGFAILKTLNVGLDLSQGVYNTAAILMPNNAPIWYRNAANSGNLNILNVDASNNLVLGTSAGVVVIGTSVYLPSSAFLTWNNDAFITRKGAGRIQVGAADAAAPISQAITAQSVVAGTTNTAGQNFLIQGSAGTGTGTGGSLLFQTAPAGSTGSAQNAYSTVLTLDPFLGATFAGLIAMPNNVALYFRNAANSAYINSLYLDSSNQLNIGNGAALNIFGSPIYLGPSAYLNFNNDTFLTRKGAAQFQLGAADSAAPVTQYLGAQSVVAGTTNTAGSNLVIKGSASTGNANGGQIFFQVTPPGATGSAQNAYASAMWINADTSVNFAAGIAAAGVSITNTGSGATLTMTGTGATTPTKFVQVVAGAFRILNNAGSTAILTLSDAGALSITSGLTLPAGSTTVAPLTLTAGTNLTTPAAGAMEYDGSVFYVSPTAGNRGLMKTVYVASLSSTYTLVSQTAAQKLFNTSTNGTITLPIGTYWFECSFTLSSMSATSGSFGFALGGTATFTQGWQANAMKVATLSAAANATNLTYNTAANTTLVTANTNTNGYAYIEGLIRVTVAGTIIPQVSLDVAAAAIVGANSYFKIVPMSGSATGTNVGPWS